MRKNKGLGGMGCRNTQKFSNLGQVPKTHLRGALQLILLDVRGDSKFVRVVSGTRPSLKNENSSDLGHFKMKMSKMRRKK